MNLKEIVGHYLKANGFDGLFSPDHCACEKDDLFPCGNPTGECEAGYKTPCECGERCDFDIGPVKWTGGA